MTAHPPLPRRRLRAVALAIATLLGSGLVGAVVDAAPASASDEGTVLVPASQTVATPETGDCPARNAPEPIDGTSEAVSSGQPSPRPLPVPERPVGGKKLGTCGFAVPQGSRPLPSDISAAAWVVADLDTGDVLAAKDPHGRYRPASTLKLLTMNVLLSTLTDLDAIVIGSDEDAAQEGSRVGIGDGGRYTVEQLMLFLMMGSGNDVANALARANGGTEHTVEQMNAMAAELGALDTRAATVSGLDGPGQMTSAYDLALIARSDMQHKTFRRLIATKYSEVPGFGDYPAFGIANDNKLLFGYRGALGGKTGYTDAAGNTFVGMAERDGRRLVVTMLHGTQQPRPQWMQAASLLTWGFNLRAGTTPVGRLVSSGVEATEVASTASIPAAPTRSTLTLGRSRQPTDRTTSPTTSATTGPTPADAGESSSAPGSGSAIVLWVGGIAVVLLAVVAVAMGLRGSGSRDDAEAPDNVPDEPGDDGDGGPTVSGDPDGDGPATA